MVCVDFFFHAAIGLYHRVTSTFNGKTSSVIIVIINKYDENTLYVHNLSAQHHDSFAIARVRRHLRSYILVDILPRCDYTKVLKRLTMRLLSIWLFSSFNWLRKLFQLIFCCLTHNKAKHSTVVRNNKIEMYIAWKEICEFSFVKYFFLHLHSNIYSIEKITIDIN